jgi:glycerophosphoryl diester phosphodiesterase
MAENILVSSFNPIVLRIVKVINSKIKTGYLIKSLSAILFLSLARPNYIHPRADILCEGLIAYAKKRRKKLNVWTVNTRPAVNYIIKYNVAGIITDKEEIGAILT